MVGVAMEGAVVVRSWRGRLVAGGSIVIDHWRLRWVHVDGALNLSRPYI